MNRTTRIKTILMVAVLLTSVVIHGSFADSTKSRNKNRKGSNTKPRGTDAITLSGTMTGSLQGKIRVGKREVTLTRDTRIYKNGKGLLDYGSYVVDSPVYIICTKQDGKTFATLVIVSDQKQPDNKPEGAIVDRNRPQ